MTEDELKRRIRQLERAIRKHRKEVWPLAKKDSEVGCEDDRVLYEVLKK